jgi:hypothetical protein
LTCAVSRHALQKPSESVIVVRPIGLPKYADTSKNT